ncbi:hypothetical protein SAMN02745866_01138 [Alteromonadaceae bacterium Bs31]|nr:hypothetical protein SAMN02745866_01138 [Alteromonadaceae bacterium Bs31]
MPEEKKPFVRKEIIYKTASTLITGILIAWAGLVGNWVLSSTEAKKENARLVTELQVRREQAESDLRKDIFDQALEKLLTENLYKISIENFSRRLLHLELLALNFGDTLSISPLFNKLNKDLAMLPVNSVDDRVTIREYRSQLQSLAKRVASAQLSFIEQHGQSFEIIIPLSEAYAVELEDSELQSCARTYYSGDNQYKWPDDQILNSLYGSNSKTSSVSVPSTEHPSPADNIDQGIQEWIYETGLKTLSGISRAIEINISDINTCTKSMTVSISIHDCDLPNQTAERCPQQKNTSLLSHLFQRDDELKTESPQATRSTFKLDYFNFPKVDNTRLSSNQRFSISLHTIDDNKQKLARLKGVIFDAEYASKRDKPSMTESLRMLDNAVNQDY